jgi:hypothetical protein
MRLCSSPPDSITTSEPTDIAKQTPGAVGSVIRAPRTYTATGLQNLKKQKTKREHGTSGSYAKQPVYPADSREER